MPQDVSFAIHLEQREDYQFNMKFDWPDVPDLSLDSGPPLGRGAGPDAERLLAAAVGYCLTASLLFCMRKFKQTPGTLRTDVSGVLERNERGRLRVGALNARIHLSDEAGQIAHFDRCAKQFEDFCVVSDSVRHGIALNVEIVDAAGRQVYPERNAFGARDAEARS
jgi:organic hydroperoxide reductase OsmC/OhrA